jgi:hypothetical protein
VLPFFGLSQSLEKIISALSSSCFGQKDFDLIVCEKNKKEGIIIESKVKCQHLFFFKKNIFWSFFISSH